MEDNVYIYPNGQRRISVYQTDIGYDNNYLYYEAYLDGQKIDGVTLADEYHGEIRFYKYNKDGSVKIVFGDPVIQIEFGNVIIKNKTED